MPKKSLRYVRYVIYVRYVDVYRVYCVQYVQRHVTSVTIPRHIVQLVPS